jgi:hypothetical protein
MPDFPGRKRNRGCRTKMKDMEKVKMEEEEKKRNENRKSGGQEYEVER